MSGMIDVPAYRSVSNAIIVNPTITAGAYTSGMQLGGIMTLTNALNPVQNRFGLSTALLHEVTILDKSSVSASFDIWLFNALPTIASSDHVTFNLTDANMLAATVGFVSVGSSYSTSTSNAISSTTNLNKQVRSSIGTTVYAVAVIRTAVTYTSVSDIQFQFCFLED